MASTSVNRSGTQRVETEQEADGTHTENAILSKQQALCNTLILKKVLGYVNHNKDLLSCRAVNSDWKSLATEILLQRKSVSISLMYNKKRRAYFKGNKKRDTWMFHAVNKECFPLQNLLSLIKSKSTALEKPGSGFPCSSFLIFGGDLEADDISSFFHLFGDGVEKLKLLLSPVSKWIDTDGERPGSVLLELPEISTVRNILCLQLPNLRELEILSDDYSTWRTYFDKDFAFHHLFQEFEITCKPEFPEFQPASNPKPKPTGTPTALSLGAQVKKEKIIMSRLGKLEKLGLNIHDYHNFHEDYPETSDSFDPPKSVIQKNMFESKSVEFIEVSKKNYMDCGDCLTALMSSKQIDQLRRLSIPAVGLEIMERIIAEFPSQLNLGELSIGFTPETQEELTKDELMKKRMIRGLVAIFKIVAKNSPKICADIWGPMGFLSDADFFIPSMDNVSDLKLDLPQNDETWRILNPNPNPLEPGEHADQPRFEMDLDYRQFFPCGFNLSDSFPNLQTIELNLWRRDITAEFWGQNCQSLPTVKNFTLTCYGPAQEFSVSGYSKLSEIFPNLKKINIRSFTNFPAVAHCLWKFKELEQLSIVICTSEYRPRNSKEKGAIDAAITGFTMETLKELRGSVEFLEWAKSAEINFKTEIAHEKTKDQEERKGKNKGNKKQKEEEMREKIPLKLPQWLLVKNPRVNPSICDLTKLKIFTVGFRDSDYYPTKSHVLMSKLSALLAFGLMPQLRVRIFPEAERPANLKRMVTRLWELRPLVSEFDVLNGADGLENARSPEDIHYHDRHSGRDADSNLDSDSEQISD